MSVLAVRGDAVAEIARFVVDEAVTELRRPEVRAGLAVTMVTTALLSRAGLRLGPTLMIALMAGSVAESGYRMLADISGKLAGAPELVFHGAGCPGHTTGLPAGCCMADTDATGEV